MSEPEITITVSIPPLYNDAEVLRVGRFTKARSVRWGGYSKLVAMRDAYEAERMRLIQRIAFLERMLNDVANSEDE